MSFGVSIGDAIKVVSLLLTAYKDFKSAPRDLTHATNDAESLELVLKALVEEFADSESPLQQDVNLQQSLEKTIKSCNAVLKKLHTIVIKFKDAPESKLSIRERFRVPKEDLLEIARKLCSYKATLSTALHVKGLRAFRDLSGGVDRKLGDMLAVMTRFEETHRAEQARIGSTMSNYSNDEIPVWKAFRRDLIRDGMNSADISKYKNELKTHLKMLTDKNLVEVEVATSTTSQLDIAGGDDAASDNSANEGTVTHGSPSTRAVDTGGWGVESNIGEPRRVTDSTIRLRTPFQQPLIAQGNNFGSPNTPSIQRHSVTPDASRDNLRDRYNKEPDNTDTPEYLAEYLDDDGHVEQSPHDTQAMYHFLRVYYMYIFSDPFRKFWKWLRSKDYKCEELPEAAYTGNKSEVARLLAKGCPVDFPESESGETALHSAIGGGHRAIVSLLLDRGANMNIKDSDGDTPLHTAVMGSHDWAVELFCSKANTPRSFSNPFRWKIPHLDIEAANKEGETALSLAVKDGNYNSVRILLRNGANVDTLCNGLTPLHSAVCHEHSKIIPLLLENGADIESQASGITPLIEALEHGHLASARLLVEKGADVAAPCQGKTPLITAVSQGSIDIVSLILSNMSGHNGRGDINTRHKGLTALVCAVRAGRQRMVALLLEHGADPDRAIGLGLPQDSQIGSTPLILATQLSRRDIITTLLDRNADINLGLRGWTPLIYAAGNGDHQTVSLLLDRGADIESVTTGHENAPLHLATTKGHLETIKVLLQNNANIEVIDLQGYTPLLFAAKQGHYRAVAYLLEKGAEVNVKTSEMTTALHLAIRSGNEELIALLLEKGANINAKTTSGRTPLHDGAQGQNHRIIQLLIDNDADIEAQDYSEGGTALHEAVKRGRSGVVKLLIDNRANVESKMFQTGATSLHLAVNKDLTDMIDLLLKHGANIEATMDYEGDEETPLRTAVRLKRVTALEMLLDRGANVDSRSGVYGDTALHTAATTGSLPIIATLLKYGAKVDIRQGGGGTPIYQACGQEKVQAVTYLLEMGADPNVATNNGNTPLSKALLCKNSALIDILLKHKVHVSDEQKPIIRMLMSEKRGSSSALRIHGRMSSQSKLPSIREPSSKEPLSNGEAVPTEAKVEDGRPQTSPAPN